MTWTVKDVADMGENRDDVAGYAGCGRRQIENEKP